MADNPEIAKINDFIQLLENMYETVNPVQQDYVQRTYFACCKLRLKLTGERQYKNGIKTLRSRINEK